MTGENLDGARGKIFKVDPGTMSFELLKETVFDPKTNEGKSRHTVYWKENTEFKKVVRHRNFKDIRGRQLAEFYNLNEKWVKEIKAGNMFKDRYVRILPATGRPHGLSKDESSIVGWFTPDKSDKSHKVGLLEFNGQKIQASLLGPNGAVDVYSPASAMDITTGFWEAKIRGEDVGGRFVVSAMEITPMPDPREADDPGLPRVLVVGDSISMNYHRAAKENLEGVANYHRIEGNGGSADRGALCIELWLGDYSQKGLHWDLIQFNHGLHDLKQVYDKETDTYSRHNVSLEDYKKYLEMEIQLMKKTGAKLMWCTTTPVPNRGPVWGDPPMGRRKDEDLVFNKAAMEVISRHPDILVNDINTFIRNSREFDKWREGNDVHFWGVPEQDLVGKAVADAIKKAIDNK